VAIFVLKDRQGKDLPVRTALEGSFVLREITPQNEGEIKGALLAHGAENFAEAARLKRQNGALAVFGLREYPAGHDFLAAIERSYADLLENRFALSAATVGGKGFILTGERGIELAADADDLARKLTALVKSRFPQAHNKTILRKIPAFPAAVARDCAEMSGWMQEWEKLALFPGYQPDKEAALYPDAEFGFVARRSGPGTLVTARASNKAAPTDKDICLITAVDADGAVTVQSTGRKASLNGPLAHLILAQRPEINYIVHSHIFLPEGVSTRAPSAPGTKGDWSAIEPAVKSGAQIINQPCHGTLILLEKPEDLLPLLKRQSLYSAQSAHYDRAYARFQGKTNIEKFIETLHLPAMTQTLDLCCGTGASTLALQDIGFTDVDFADGAPAMLAVAERRLGRKGKLVKLESLELIDERNYGLVTMRQAFNYVAKPDLKSFFEKAHGILAPGGHFVFNSFRPLADGIDRRRNISGKGGVIAVTDEINVIKNGIVRHAQRTEIIDTNTARWTPVHDINEFYQHEPERVAALLKAAGFEAKAHITGNSICYHAVKKGPLP
jgi:ubiquinone/menaquinone biosynthesis C-methylase UbiE